MTWLRGAAIGVLALAAGCATPTFKPTVLECKHLRLTPVTHPTDPLAFRAQGFTVLPPRGEHWCIGQTASRGVAFVTSPFLGTLVDHPPTRAETAHTFVAAVMVLDVPESKLAAPDALRVLAEQMTRSEGRFKVIDSRVVPDTSLGLDCFRMNAVIEERDNPKMPGVVLIQVLRDNFVCRHPQATPSRVVLIGASERYVQSQPPPPLLIDELRPEWEPFVHSLRFDQPQ